jgi:hypothetical protein
MKRIKKTSDNPSGRYLGTKVIFFLSVFLPFSGELEEKKGSEVFQLLVLPSYKMYVM